MTAQLYLSKPAPMLVAEFTALAQALLETAKRTVNKPCVARVVCQDTCFDDVGKDMDLNYVADPQGPAMNNEIRTRELRLEDLTAADLKRDGLIQVVISPMENGRPVAGAFATLSTSAGRDTVWAQIHSAQAKEASLQPLARLWNKQASFIRSPRLIWGAIRKFFMA